MYIKADTVMLLFSSLSAPDTYKDNFTSFSHHQDNPGDVPLIGTKFISQDKKTNNP